MTNKEKSCKQLIRELDILIEADFAAAKAELEQFKNQPSVFTLFEINEQEVTNDVICSIFADDDQLSDSHGKGSIS
jgi:hypothetical protein